MSHETCAVAPAACYPCAVQGAVAMPGEVLSTFLRDGRTCAIVRVNELIVEVVIEPHIDDVGETRGYYYWIRGAADPHASELLAIQAAMADISRMSRVQPVAVVQLGIGEILNAC